MRLHHELKFDESLCNQIHNLAARRNYINKINLITDTESSDSRAGTSTPPQTPPIPYTPVVKEFTIKETSPINNEGMP